MPLRPTLLAASLAAPALGAECEPLALGPRASMEVPGDTPACYEVPVEPGQRAHVQVLEGEDTLFSVDGVAQAQEDYAFVVQDGPLRVRATSAAGTEGAPFVLRLTLAPPRADAPGAWRVEEEEGRVTGLVWLGEEGGPSVSVACRTGGGALVMTYDGLGTAALVREDDALPRGAIEVEGPDGTARHEVVFERVDGFDRYWQAEPAPALLDDLARGTRMRLLDAEGSSAGAVGLEGAAALREAMVRRCGL